MADRCGDRTSSIEDIEDIITTSSEVFDRTKARTQVTDMRSVKFMFPFVAKIYCGRCMQLHKGNVSPRISETEGFVRETTVSNCLFIGKERSIFCHV